MSLQSPLDSKEIKPVNLKGNQPWILIGNSDAKAETLKLWPSDEKSGLRKELDAGKHGRQEEKGMTEDELVGWHHRLNGHAAAAKLLQSCPTLCDPIDSSPPGFTVPKILQTRTLEWVAISFSNVWKWKWSCLVGSDSSWPQGLQPTRLLCPWDFPVKSTGLAWHCLLCSGHEFEPIPGDSESQRSLACCSPWGCRLGHDLATEQQQQKCQVKV